MYVSGISLFLQKKHLLHLAQESENSPRPLDKTAFEQLFRSEFKNFCFLAIKYVKDYDVAKEMVQDSFISLWEKRATIDTDRQVLSYVASTVRNRCLNWLRDHKKFNSYLLDIEEISYDLTYMQSDKLVESELRLEIEHAIDELPDKCREIFRLSRYENLKYHEIAIKLEISVKTVETQMSKALQHMRTRLIEYTSFIFLMLWINLY